MKTRHLIMIFAGIICLVAISSCNSDKSKGVTLYDKSLSEIKQKVNGEWELVSGKNAREIGEFENTFITFDNDKYIWTENGVSEPGELNWRKESTGMGYDAYMMDVFYSSRPSFPIAINGDTLYIQDCSETGYKYTLVKKSSKK